MRCAMFMLVSIYVLMALPLFWLSWLIGKKKKVHLIAGYVPGKYNDEKLARTNALALTLVGLICLALAVVHLFVGDGDGEVIAVIVANITLTIVVTIWTLMVVNRDCKKSD